MKVYLRQDIPRVGLQGEIIKVSEGYAFNYLIPKKLAVAVTAENESFFKSRMRVIEHRKEVVATETSILAEKIKSIEITLKKKMHDTDKLYGAVSAQEIADALAQKGIKIAKSQVIFDKSIKEKGSYMIIIKLSSRLQPTLKVIIISE